MMQWEGEMGKSMKAHVTEYTVRSNKGDPVSNKVKGKVMGTMDVL